MDCEELIQKINDIRKNKSYLTNAFFTKPQLDTLLAKGGTHILKSRDLLLILVEETDLVRIFFYAVDNVALGEIKDLMLRFNKPVVTDVVGKNPKAEALAQVLIDVGFEQYSIFVRMICNDLEKLDYVDTSTVEYAKTDDIDAIIELLYSGFDPLFSHIPLVEEIAVAIEKKEITVVRRRQELAGLAFFEVISPRNVCLRYIIVNKNYRRQGIGNALLARSFAYHGEGIKYTLWVGANNSAMNKYRRLNFKQDGMIDYILKFKGE